MIRIILIINDIAKSINSLQYEYFNPLNTSEDKY